MNPGPGGVMGSLRDRLQQSLDYALSEVPYYRDRIGRRSQPVALADFPLLDRVTVQENFHEFIVARRFPDFVVMSGGTSGLVVNATIRNEEEYEATHEYLTGQGPGAAPAIEDVDAFGVDVYFNTNGYTRRKPRGWPMFSVPLERKVHADLITQFLIEGFEVGGRTIPARYLQAQNAIHRVLAGYFALVDDAPSGFQLDTVFGYGSHITRAWHERLHRLWGQPVTTSYGLSEFVGANALRCEDCGALHYATAWQEFLSPADHSTVDSGDALLVLTSLVPFVTVQPRIRYITGDLVSIKGTCPQTGLTGFQFRGRLASSVWADEDAIVEVLLSEIDVLEAVDQFGGLHTKRHPSEIQLWEDADLPAPPFRLGLPQFAIQATNPARSRRTVVRVETEFDPAVEVARARALEESLRSSILAEAPRFADRVVGEGDAFAVEAVPAGSLRLPSKTSA